MPYIFSVANNKNRKGCVYEKCPHCKLYITKGSSNVHIRTQCLWFKPNGTIGVYYVIKI